MTYFQTLVWNSNHRGNKIWPKLPERERKKQGEQLRWTPSSLSSQLRTFTRTAKCSETSALWPKNNKQGCKQPSSDGSTEATAIFRNLGKSFLLSSNQPATTVQTFYRTWKVHWLTRQFPKITSLGKYRISFELYPKAALPPGQYHFQSWAFISKENSSPNSRIYPWKVLKFLTDCKQKWD